MSDPATTPVPVPRPRVPLAARRCTCHWDAVAGRRTLPDPFCPAQVLHADPTDDEIAAAVARATAVAARP